MFKKANVLIYACVNDIVSDKYIWLKHTEFNTALGIQRLWYGYCWFHEENYCSIAALSFWKLIEMNSLHEHTFVNVCLASIVKSKVMVYLHTTIHTIVNMILLWFSLDQWDNHYLQLSQYIYILYCSDIPF